MNSLCRISMRLVELVEVGLLRFCDFGLFLLFLHPYGHWRKVRKDFMDGTGLCCEVGVVGFVCGDRFHAVGSLQFFRQFC